MITKSISPSEAFLKSVHGLLHLHQLEVKGLSESKEADDVRDTLDAPWYQMTEEEQNRIEGLSEDLYTISDPQQPVKEMNPQVSKNLMLLAIARSKRNLDEALSLLRRWGSHLEPAYRAFMEGHIWFSEGIYDCAAVFFNHAANLDQADDSSKVFYLQSLQNFNQSIAEEEARDILENQPACPMLIYFKAIEIQILSTREERIETAKPTLIRSIESLEQRLKQIRDKAQSDRNCVPSLTMAITLLSFCHDSIGNEQAALKYYDEGIQINPQYDSFLCNRGMLTYGKTNQAIEDFKRADRLKSPLVWPCYFLAHHHISIEEYADSLIYCKKALSLKYSNLVNSDLYQWIAISKFELGMDEQEVREAFSQAMKLNPDSEKIKSNYQIFLNAIAAHEETAVWLKESESDIRATGKDGLKLPVFSIAA